MPIILVQNPPADETHCGICREAYFTDPESDLPAMTPCGHFFGSRCLSEYLCGWMRDDAVNCPTCRARIWPMRVPPANQTPVRRRSSERQRSEQAPFTGSLLHSITAGFIFGLTMKADNVQWILGSVLIANLLYLHPRTQ